MKAIVTKYHGPTNFKGSRITASDEDGNRTTISYPYELSGQDCHEKAAYALCDKMGWKGRLIGGSLKRGYVFVFVEGGTALPWWEVIGTDRKVGAIGTPEEFNITVSARARFEAETKAREQRYSQGREHVSLRTVTEVK